jgi:hypothetical protein
VKQGRAALAVFLVAAMILLLTPSGLRAESAVPTPGAFFGLTPGLFDPNAPGTKLSGTLAIAYDAGPAPEGCASFLINNMYVVLTLQQGNSLKPFNTHFGLAGVAPFCFDDQVAQVNFVVGLVNAQVMPFFFGSSIFSCAETGGVRPCWAIKSVTNFLSSGTGANSSTITLAVR